MFLGDIIASNQMSYFLRKSGSVLEQNYRDLKRKEKTIVGK